MSRQDRALARQRAAERRKNAAGLAVASLQKQLTEIDAALTDLANAPEAELASRAGNYGRQLAADSVLLVFFERKHRCRAAEPFRGKGGCLTCHPAPNFTDEEFHNTGVAWRDDYFADDGRGTVTGNAGDRGAFKTPTLRESARTAPYMHDGSLATLNDVVDFYSRGGRPNPNLDPRIRPRDLDHVEQRALVAFLRSLTGRVRDGL